MLESSGSRPRSPEGSGERALWLFRSETKPPFSLGNCRSSQTRASRRGCQRRDSRTPRTHTYTLLTENGHVTHTGLGLSTPRPSGRPDGETAGATECESPPSCCVNQERVTPAGRAVTVQPLGTGGCRRRRKRPALRDQDPAPRGPSLSVPPAR